MFKCVGCEGTVESLNGQCFCGKTTTDHKGRVKGENFMEIAGQKIIERSKVRTCPHCGWTGLVIPRIDLGCPDHGIWYKSSGKNYTTEIEGKDDDREPEGRNEVHGGGPRDGKKRKYSKERQRLPRFGTR